MTYPSDSLSASLASALAECVDPEAGCTAACLIDLDSGLTLGVQPDGALGSGHAERLAAAAVELLDSPSAREIGAGIAEGERRLPREAIVAGRDGLAVFGRSADGPDRVVCLVFDRADDPGAALAAARSAIGRLAAVLPF